MSEVSLTIAANLLPIAAACLLCLLIGWLWFRPGALAGLPQSAEFLPRFAIYAILGWFLIIVGSSWLRILAVPFRKSAPFLLAVLLAVPLAFWLWRLWKERGKLPDWKTYLQLRAGPAGCLLLAMGLFAVVLTNRLTVPSLYDVGGWGFDQVNYVHIADQYIENGMFEPKDSASGGVIGPWFAFNGNLIRNCLSFDKSRWNAIYDFSSNPDVQTYTRQLSLIMRSGGAALDSSFASWFRLDGVQAYVLGNYIQYLFLALAGVWVGLVARIHPIGCLLLGALASLWPIAIFSNLLDNRDQALALVIILVLLGSVLYRQLNIWARGLALGALALIYIEILPVVAPLWLLAHLDERPLRLAGKHIGQEIGIALACTFLYVPWGTQFLFVQLSSSDTMKLQLPLGAFFGPLSTFAGTFAGIRFDGSQLVLVFAMVAGAALIALQILGLAVWLKDRRFGACAGFFLLAAISIHLNQIGYAYAGYKLFTVLFPAIILLCAGSFSIFSRSLAGPSGLPGGLWKREPVLILIALCLPGVLLGSALRSGFSFSDVKYVIGTNSVLEDWAGVTTNAGLRVRDTDLEMARSIVANVKKKQGVLFSNFDHWDVAYFAHFFGSQRPISLLYGFSPQTNPLDRNVFAKNMRFVEAGQPIHWLLLLNDETVGRARYDTPDNIVILKGQPVKIESGRTFTAMQLKSKEEFVFAQRLYSQILPKAISRETKNSEFLLGKQGVVFGVYAVNSSAEPRKIRFDVVSAGSRPLREKLGEWQCFVNGKPAENLVKTPLPDGARFSISLDSEPAGHVIEVGPASQLPFQFATERAKAYIAGNKAKDVYKVKDFVLENSRQ